MHSMFNVVNGQPNKCLASHISKLIQSLCQQDMFQTRLSARAGGVATRFQQVLLAAVFSPQLPIYGRMETRPSSLEPLNHNIYSHSLHCRSLCCKYWCAYLEFKFNLLVLQVILGDLFCGSGLTLLQMGKEKQCVKVSGYGKNIDNKSLKHLVWGPHWTKLNRKKIILYNAFIICCARSVYYFTTVHACTNN